MTTVGDTTLVQTTPDALRKVGGSRNPSFNFWVLKAAMNVRTEIRSMSAEDRDQQVRAVMSAMTGLAPTDEIEGMMAAQAVALHIGTMECFRRAAIPEQSFEVATVLRKQGASLSRAFVELTSALDRRRGKGIQQIVRVERVEVAAGGQAIVGNVTPADRRDPEEGGGA